MIARLSKPLKERPAERIRRVCSPTHAENDMDHPWLSFFGLLVLVLGIVVVGGLAMFLASKIIEAYATWMSNTPYG